MTMRIDDTLSAKFQACCLNYNHYLKKFFGDRRGIDKHLALSLQFSAIKEEQHDLLSEYTDLPRHITACVSSFETGLSEQEYNSTQFAYRVIYVPKLVNHKGQADKVIEFIKSDNPLAQQLSRSYTVIKETEKPKYLPSQIVRLMKDEGYSWFSMARHSDLWRAEDGRNPAKGFGVQIAKTWYWYESWVNFVRAYCRAQPTPV